MYVLFFFNFSITDRALCLFWNVNIFYLWNGIPAAKKINRTPVAMTWITGWLWDSRTPESRTGLRFRSCYAQCFWAVCVCEGLGVYATVN